MICDKCGNKVSFRNNFCTKCGKRIVLTGTYSTSEIIPLFVKGNEVLILWWVNKKKNGFDINEFKFPQWFWYQYGIDFKFHFNKLLENGYLINNNNFIFVTEKGNDYIKEKIAIIEKHTDKTKIPLVEYSKDRQNSYDYGEDLGLHILKRWTSTKDDKTRESHRLAHGQTVPNSLPFIIGGEKLMFPCDENGSPENIDDCRCCMVAEVVTKKQYDYAMEEYKKGNYFSDWKNIR